MLVTQDPERTSVCGSRPPRPTRLNRRPDTVFITSAGQIGKQRLRHLCCKVFEQPARLREVPIAEMHERQIEWREPPVGDHLDETTRADEFRLYHRRQLSDPAAGKQCGGETGEIIHGQVGTKGNGFFGPLVLVHEAPTCLWLTASEREQRMVEQVLGRFRRPAALQIVRAGDQLAAIGQHLARNQ